MKKGFTLIEIIVALGIFSIVATVALAALVKIVDANKKAQTTQDAVLGLSFALEAMSREIRTASNIRCETSSSGSVTNPTSFLPQACIASAHNQLIVFRSTNVDYTSTPPCRLVYAYLFKTNPDGTYSLNKAHQTAGTVNDGQPHCLQTFDSDSFSPITPTSVTLTEYQLRVSPATYPIVFTLLSGYAGTRDRVKTFFTVQTAISQRTL